MTSYMTSCSAEIGGFCDLSYLGVSLLSGVFFHYKQHNVAQLEHGNGCIPESPTITSSLGALSPRNPSAGAGRRQQCRLGRTCRSRWHENQPEASGRRSPHINGVYEYLEVMYSFFEVKVTEGHACHGPFPCHISNVICSNFTATPSFRDVV